MNNKLLSNIDLDYFYKKFKIQLNGIYSKDLLKNIKNIKEGNYIINLQDSDKGNGSHWVALTIHNNIAIYYDSFGFSMPNTVMYFIKRYNKKCKIVYSIDQIQNINSVYCGWFVLFFHLYITKIIKSKNYYGYFINKHNSFFVLNNTLLNDKILKELIKNYIEIERIE